MSRYNWYRI